MNSPEPTLADALRAWQLVVPDGCPFTHLTPAELRGWRLPAPTDRPVFAAVGPGRHYPERRGLQLSRLVQQPEVELVQGLPVTCAAETLLACARDLDVLDLVPLLDSALRAGDCSIDELAELAATRRWGARNLRRSLAAADTRSESAWESVMRVLHRAAGLDVVPQHELRSGTGRLIGYADLWLVGTRRLHEYDGEVHRGLAEHRADLRRDRALVEENWQRFGYTATEILRQGGSIIASSDAALGRR